MAVLGSLFPLGVPIKQFETCPIGGTLFEGGASTVGVGIRAEQGHSTDLYSKSKIGAKNTMCGKGGTSCGNAN